MPVHVQRGDRVRILLGPALRQRSAPGRQRLRVRHQLAQAPPQRARAGTAVQAQQLPPLAGLLVAEPLGTLHAQQQQEGQREQDRAHAEVARRQAQQAAMRQQALGQQRGQGRQHAAAGHGRGGGLEARLTLGQQPQAGLDASLRVMGRPALRSLRVAPVALLAVQPGWRRQRLGGCRRRIRHRRSGCGLAGRLRRGPGGRRWGRRGWRRIRRDGGQQTLQAIRAQRGVAQVELPRGLAQAGAGGQHLRGALEDLRVLDAVPPAGLVLGGEAGFALAFEALAGAQDGAGAEAEGAGEFGEGGELVEGALGEAAIAGAGVVGGVGGEGDGEGEIDDAIAVAQEAEAVIDGDGLGGLEFEGGGKAGRPGHFAIHTDIIN